jgi:hypothetical protein
MGILLAFAPFIAFAIINRLIGPTQGLVAGALASAILLIRDWMNPKRKPKVLELGTLFLFGGLALYAFLVGPRWSVVEVRLRVDAGLLILVLATMIIRRPFTLQYAREKVAVDSWGSPGFIRTNYIITGVWAAAFAVLIGADLLMVYRPNIPRAVGVIVTVLALVGAFQFTQWYPARRPS